MVWPTMEWRYGRRNAKASQRRRRSWRCSKRVLGLLRHAQAQQQIGKSGVSVEIVEGRIALQERDSLAVAFRVSLVEPFEGAVLVARKGVNRSNQTWSHKLTL